LATFAVAVNEFSEGEARGHNPDVLLHYFLPLKPVIRTLLQFHQLLGGVVCLAVIGRRIALVVLIVPCLLMSVSVSALCIFQLLLA
jgi:hypothetical protein